MDDTTRSAGKTDRVAKHIWIELIAFDALAEDCGVGAVLEAMGPRPDFVSLLLYSPEFLHGHDEEDSGRLPTECNSYGARPISARGARQEWTRGDLRRLVAVLRESGLAVYFAVFDLHGYTEEGVQKYGAWVQRHPELTVTDASGERRNGMINPLKRLADGTRYQDFFVSKLVEVMGYYGFDGYHGADGYSSGRLALWQGDFSADHVDDFVARTSTEVSGASIADRAEWIWANARETWIAFHADRWTEFWQASCDGVHASGGRVVLNNAWTRDPFEALARYGVDYRRLVAAGVDGFVLETGSSALDVLEETELSPIYGQLACILLISATVPGTTLAGLTALHDTYEEWDVVHTAPAMLERDLRLLTSMRIQSDGSTTKPCLDAALFCLSDGLSDHAWNGVNSMLETIYAGPGVLGATPTLLYSPDIQVGEHASYSREQLGHTHAVLAELLRQGAVVSTVARVEDHETVPGTVLLLRPELYDADLVEKIATSHDTVVMIGPDITEAGSYSGSWSLRVLRNGVPIAAEGAVGEGASLGSDQPQSWLLELPMAMPPTAVLRQAAQVLRPAMIGDGGPRGSIGPSAEIQLVVTAASESRATVILHNAQDKFTDGSFVPASAVADMKVISRTEAELPVRVLDGVVGVRVPPKGVVALQMNLRALAAESVDQGLD